MSGRIVSFLRRAVPRDWAAQELAEFYRVESALVQSGLRVCSDRGVSDEGDPWFVFCRAEDDEVIVHFARIGGRYLISAPAFGANVIGHDFRALVRGLVDRHPMLQPQRRDDNVVFHPSALLVLLVASALLKTAHAAEAAAAPSSGPPGSDAGRTLLRPADGTPPAPPAPAAETVTPVWHQDAAILSAVILAATVHGAPEMPTVVVSAHAHGLPIPDHLPSSLLWFGPDSGLDASPVGAGSVSPIAQSAMPSLSQLANDTAHEHTAAFSPLPPLPVAAGGFVSADPGLPSATLTSLSAVPTLGQPTTDLAVAPGSHAVAPFAIQGEAATLVHALGGNEPILYAATLPDALSVPLHASVHTTADDLASQLHAAAAGASASSATASGGAAAAPAEAASAASGSDGASTQAAHALVSTTSTLPAGDLSAVLANVETFTAEVGPHVVVLATSSQVIVFDSYAIDHTPAAVAAVTYDFADGTSVSLVGLPSELPHTLV